MNVQMWQLAQEGQWISWGDMSCIEVLTSGYIVGR
jgi:hypothetical protein